MVINKISKSSLMYLLKREKGKAIKGIKSYGLIHHAVATWQLILAKSFSYC